MIFLVNRSQVSAFAWLIPSEIYKRLQEPDVFLVGAVTGRAPVGAAVLELQWERAQLLSICVAPEQRRCGLARAMMHYCVNCLQGTTRQALYAALPEGENPALTAFFASLGWFEPTEPSKVFRFQLGQAAALPVLQGPFPHVQPLHTVSDAAYHAYISTAFPDDPSQCHRQSLDQQVSQARLHHNNMISALLISQQQDGLSIDWLQSSSQSPRDTLYLLRAALSAACERYPTDTTITLSTLIPSAIRLAEKILDGISEQQTWQFWEIAGPAFRLLDQLPDSEEEVPQVQA